MSISLLTYLFKVRVIKCKNYGQNLRAYDKGMVAPVAGGCTTVIRESSAIVLNFGASVLTFTFQEEDIHPEKPQLSFIIHNLPLVIMIIPIAHLTLIEPCAL